MMTDEQLAHLLRQAATPMTHDAPSRDLWPAVVARTHEPVGWSWLDLGMAAALITGIALEPQWLWLLAYHL
jgi:hypothetical protein